MGVTRVRQIVGEGVTRHELGNRRVIPWLSRYSDMKVIVVLCLISVCCGYRIVEGLDQGLNPGEYVYPDDFDKNENGRGRLLLMTDRHKDYTPEKLRIIIFGNWRSS